MERTWYLAHPFNSRFKIREWELEIESNTDFDIINPFFDVERDDANVILDNGTTLETQATREERYNLSDKECFRLVRRDLNLINRSDSVIVVIDGSLSYGTIQEMVYAFSYNKFVLAIVTNGHIGHPWLRYHSHKIVESLDEAKEYLIEINSVRVLGE